MPAACTTLDKVGCVLWRLCARGWGIAFVVDYWGGESLGRRPQALPEFRSGLIKLEVMTGSTWDLGMAWEVLLPQLEAQFASWQTRGKVELTQECGHHPHI